MKNFLCGIIILSFPWLVFSKQTTDCLHLHIIDAEPLGFINENGTLAGVQVDYLNAIEKTSGVCIIKKLLPYPRIWQSINMGKHDGGIVFRSESRSHMVEYVESIREVPTVVVPLKTVTIKEYDDLKGKVIGKTRDSHLNDRFDNDHDINKIEVNNYQQAAQMVKVHRLDAIAGSIVVLVYQLRKHDALQEVNLKQKFTLGSKVQWFQLSKNSQHIDKIPQLRKAIISLKAAGTFDAIMEKYYGKDWQVMFE